MSLLTEIILFTRLLFIFSVKAGEVVKSLVSCLFALIFRFMVDFDSFHINVDYRG